MKKLTLAFLLLCSASIYGQRIKPTIQPPPKPTPMPQAQQKRHVKVNLKSGDPVSGDFIGANATSVQVVVAGNHLDIKLDDISSLVFDESATVSQPKPDPAQAAAQTALKSLRRLSGATEVGINFTEYSSRLIDVKSDVDEAMARLPDSELKSEINAAMAAYADAGQAWNRMLGGGGRYIEAALYPDKDEWAKSLQAKYQIPIEQTNPAQGVPQYLLKTAPSGALDPIHYMRQSVVLSTIWAAAHKHNENAEALLTK